MPEIRTRAEWQVAFWRADSDAWPVYDSDWQQLTIRPALVIIQIAAGDTRSTGRPLHPAEIVRAELHGQRVRRDGSLGETAEAGWANRAPDGSDSFEHATCPDWVAGLARQALAMVKNGENAHA